MNSEFFEMRWLRQRNDDREEFAELEYRTRSPVVDASGAFCGFGEWGEWKEVPFVQSDIREEFLDLRDRG